MSRLTPERTALARDIIARYPVSRSALIPLIHLAQEQDGYVTDDAMEHIAELIGCTPAEVYGTGSFYEMFKFHPVGKYVVGVCTNISCLLQGAEELLEHAQSSLGVRTGGTTADNQFTLEDVECIAACTLAPCIQVNYRYFPNVTPASFDRLVGDLRSGALDDVVPPHGTLARVRQDVPTARWASSAAAAPRLPDVHPGPALGGGPAGADGTDSAANEPSGADAGQHAHGHAIGEAVAEPRPDPPNPPSPGAEPTR
ncbi:MAG: NADH-quinone oxidoreductase subunit NuoE [Acidimicrobiales bacterium]